MKSLIGRPKMHMAGESLVSGSVVLWYWSITRWTASVSTVQLPIGTSVVVDEAFDCLHANFGPAVAVREGH